MGFRMSRRSQKGSPQRADCSSVVPHMNKMRLFDKMPLALGKNARRPRIPWPSPAPTYIGTSHCETGVSNTSVGYTDRLGLRARDLI